MLAEDDDGGNTDDDEKIADAFLQTRKAGRAFRKVTGQNKGQRDSSSSSQSGKGYRGWWDGKQSSPPRMSPSGSSSGKGKIIKGSKKSGGRSPSPFRRSFGKGKKGKGKGTKGKAASALGDTLACLALRSRPTALGCRHREHAHGNAQRAVAVIGVCDAGRPRAARADCSRR